MYYRVAEWMERDKEFYNLTELMHFMVPHHIKVILKRKKILKNNLKKIINTIVINTKFFLEWAYMTPWREQLRPVEDFVLKST